MGHNRHRHNLFRNLLFGPVTKCWEWHWKTRALVCVWNGWAYRCLHSFRRPWRAIDAIANEFCCVALCDGTAGCRFCGRVTATNVGIRPASGVAAVSRVCAFFHFCICTRCVYKCFSASRVGLRAERNWRYFCGAHWNAALGRATVASSHRGFSCRSHRSADAGCRPAASLAPTAMDAFICRDALVCSHRKIYWKPRVREYVCNVRQPLVKSFVRSFMTQA